MDNAQDELKLLTLAEAAEILQVSLLRMIQKNEVLAFKIGGQWRIRKSQFRKWVEQKESGIEEKSLVSC